MPQRIQRKRTPGWRMPEGAVYVGRPSKWGNPFSAMDAGRRHPSLTAEQCGSFIVNEFKYDLRSKHPDYPSITEIREELRGKNLACWCRLDEPCHADVLLEIANKDGDQ